MPVAWLVLERELNRRGLLGRLLAVPLAALFTKAAPKMAPLSVEAVEKLPRLPELYGTRVVVPTIDSNGYLASSWFSQREWEKHFNEAVEDSLRKFAEAEDRAFLKGDK